jgi:tRNA(Arg) A34 adenosine deaminase TadA
MEIIKSRKKEKFIANASFEALKSPMLFKHGCVAVYGGKQIATGYNYYRTYSKDKSILKEYTCSMHAEIDCIRKIKNSRFKNKLKNICLYVVQISKDCEFKNSQPCSTCTSVLKEIKIKKVYYTVGNLFVCSKIDTIVPKETFGTVFLKSTLGKRIN